MARIIPLTKKQVAIVDDEDFDRVNQYKWYAHKGSRNQCWYAARTTRKLLGPRKIEWLHRFIMQPKDDEQVDHINGNGLDCRKSNMRRCNVTQNIHNRPAHRDASTGYKGIIPKNKKWMAQIQVNKHRLIIGYFDSPLEAALAYDEKARELLGEFAHTNF